MAGRLSTREGLDLVKIALGLTLVAVLIVGTWIGYRYVVQNHTVSTDDGGRATAQVVTAALFSRNDLRVSRLSGTVQGTANASRWWGWLRTSQVVKAPYTVDYFLPLGKLDLDDMRYDEGRRVLFVEAPDVSPERANIDLSRATLNRVSGVFVSRGAMVEMAPQVSASASRAARDKAIEPENMERSRAHARAALERLLGGALRAAGMPVRVEVRFAGEPMPTNTDQWDLSRSLQEVLSNAG